MQSLTKLANIPRYRFDKEFESLSLRGLSPADKLFICVQRLKNDPAKCIKILEELPKKSPQSPPKVTSILTDKTSADKISIEYLKSLPEAFTDQQTREVIALLQNPEFQGLVNHKKFKFLCNSIAGQLKRIVGGALQDNKPESSDNGRNFSWALASTGDVTATVNSLKETVIPPAEKAKLINRALVNSLGQLTIEVCDTMLSEGGWGPLITPVLFNTRDSRSVTRYRHASELLYLLNSNGERAIGNNLLADFSYGRVNGIRVLKIDESGPRGQDPLKLSDSKLWPIRTILEREIEALGRDSATLQEFQREKDSQLQDYKRAVMDLAAFLTAWQSEVYRGDGQPIIPRSPAKTGERANIEITAEADFARFKGPVDQILSELEQFSDKFEIGSTTKVFIDELIEAPRKLQAMLIELGSGPRRYHYQDVNLGPWISNLHANSPLGICINYELFDLNNLYAKRALQRRVEELVSLLKGDVSCDEYKTATSQGLKLTGLGWVDSDSEALTARCLKNQTTSHKPAIETTATAGSIIETMFLKSANNFFMIVGLTKQELLTRLIKSRTTLRDQAATELNGDEDLLSNLVNRGLLRCRYTMVAGRYEKVYFPNEAGFYFS
jgi:hypothetical protein